MKLKYLIAAFLIIYSFLINSQTTGQSWTQVGNGVSEGISTTRINVLSKINHELLAGGDFKFADTVRVNSIAKWNGTHWNSIGNGIGKVTYRGTLAIAEYNDEIYAGGDFIDSTGGGEIRTLMKWDSNDWVSISSPFDGAVEVLNDYNNVLYVAGAGLNPGYIANWNGKEWNEAEKDVNAAVFDMLVYKNELYVGGMFTEAGGVSVKGIAKWNGTELLSTGLEQFLNDSRKISVQTLYLYKGNLLVCASLGIETKLLAEWNGEVWGIIDSSFNGQILALTEFNNELYAGGKFDNVSGKQVNHIAKWDGKNWYSVDGGMNNDVYTMIVFNDELYAGGIFTIAGKVSANRIAKLSLPVGLKDKSDIPPYDYKLFQNYPNPYNPTTTINYQIPGDGFVTLKIYDVLGKEVATLVNENKYTGRYNVEFNAGNLASGVYLYQIKVNDFVSTKKLVLLK